MSRTLLVADDSLTVQRVIQLAFDKEDIEVVSVSDGRQAIEQIAAHPPDIVLAETRMPDRSGYEVSEFVKSTPAHQDIPVVLLMGAFETVDDRRVQASGCDAVLVKPFEPERLVTTVRGLLDRPNKPAAAASAEVSRIEQPSGPEPTESRDPTPAAPVAPVQQAVDLGVPPVTDELVDRVATRVIARLSDQVVREKTVEVVTQVAVRLVREEIERMKEKLR
jgi:CheY-like chemotaxis protein